MLLQVNINSGCFGQDHTLDILIAAFLAALFLQSGLDKISDRKGNLSWMTSHFSKSPFKNLVPLLLTMLTVLEVLTGVLCVSGIIMYFYNNSDLLFYWGALASAITILSMFIAQRITKDYPGANSLVLYFIVTLFALWLNLYHRGVFNHF